MIRPGKVSGFDVFDGDGKRVASCRSFVEANKLHQLHDPPRQQEANPEKCATNRTAKITQCFTESKPHRSMAMACRPSQVDEFNETRKREGRSGGQYLPDGTFECYSRKALNDELKARGLVDADAAYLTHS